MKITIVVASYWPLLDGVQMVTQYHAESLAQKGHEVSVITSCIEGRSDSESHNGVEIIRIPVYNKGYWHFGDRNQYESRIIEAGIKQDVILAVCLQSYAADWMLAIMDKVKARKVLYLHGMPDFKLHREDFVSFYNVAKTLFRNMRWWLFYKSHWYSIKKFDAVIHLFKNDNSYSYFERNGYHSNYPIENSCENIFFKNDSKTKPYFLYVGNYCQRKNQISALECFYKTELHDFGFVFIGGQDNSYYKDMIKANMKYESQYGKRDVKILYGLDRSAIIQYTKEAYATVMSSTYEYYPIVIVESMAAGVPFISTNVGIVRLLPGGVIVTNQTDMIYWMELLAKDKKMRDVMGSLGRAYANKNLTMQKKTSELEEILKNK